MTAPAQPKWMTWGGRALSALPVLALGLSAAMKLSHAAPVVEAFGKFGFSAGALTPIGLVELACAVLYAVPRSAVLGAVLVTGYLGGAVVTHARIGESFVPPFLLGVVAWAGLFFRDERIRALLPWRRPSSP